MRYRRLDVPVQKDGEGSEGYKKKSQVPAWVRTRDTRLLQMQLCDSKSWVLNHYTIGTGARVTEQRLYFSLGRMSD